MVALVTPCSPSTTRRLLERFAFQGSTPALIRRELSHLTSRELDVLRLLARGLSNAEIAEQLTLSEATVKTHVARLLAKLQIRDRGTWLYRQDQTRDLISQLRDRPATGRRATRAPTRSASGSTPPGPRSPACGPRTAPSATSSPATSASSEHSTPTTRPPDRDDAGHEPDVAGGRAAGDPALAEPSRIAADRDGRREARDG
jgi:DNA-binding CsgD family transcriptional regulator